MFPVQRCLGASHTTDHLIDRLFTLTHTHTHTHTHTTQVIGSSLSRKGDKYRLLHMLRLRHNDVSTESEGSGTSKPPRRTLGEKIDFLPIASHSSLPLRYCLNGNSKAHQQATIGCWRVGARGTIHLGDQVLLYFSHNLMTSRRSLTPSCV